MALAWAIVELINNPKMFKKLREEINRVVGSGRLVEESDVPNLPYLQAVVKETLRLHPPLPVMVRKAEKDCKISGYDISANTSIMFNLHAIMRENAPDFEPKRFVMASSEDSDHYQMAFKGNNFQLIPFGSGRRGCPGVSLSLVVIHMVLAALVQCFDFKVHGGEKVNTKQGLGFSAETAHPILCYPIPVEDALQYIHRF